MPLSDSRFRAKVLAFRSAQPRAAKDDLAVKALSVFETSVDPMWIFDLHSLVFLAVNQAAMRQYGYSRSEFLGMTILDIRPSEDIVPLVHEELRDHRHNSDAERWRHRARGGRVFEVEITSREFIYEGHEAEIVIAREVKGPDKE